MIISKLNKINFKIILINIFLIIIFFGFIIKTVSHDIIFKKGTYTCLGYDTELYEDCETYFIFNTDDTFYLYNTYETMLRYGTFEEHDNNKIELNFLDQPEIQFIEYNEDSMFSYDCRMLDDTYINYNFSLMTKYEYYHSDSIHDFYNNLKIER